MKKLIALIVFIGFYQILSAQVVATIKLLDGLQDQPVKNYSIVLTNIKTKRTYTAITNNNGLAIFNNIDEYGKYSINAIENVTYFLLSEEVNIAVNNQQAIIYLTRKLFSQLNDVIVSTANSVKLNRNNATAIQTIGRKELKVLPVEGRDITRAFIRIPNMTIATLGYAEAPNVAINGANGGFTNYMIDGMDNNERFLGNVKFNTPLGFVDAVNIYTNNFTAEYGNTPTGIINVSTRSGKNQFEGEVFYLTRPGKFTDAPSAFATRDLSGNSVKDGFSRQQLGVGFGGAIKKDKTFYYVNFEQTFDRKDNLLDVPQLNVKEIVTGFNSFSYLSGKIDHYWKPKFKTSVRLNVGQFDIDRQGGGLEGGNIFPSAGSKQANRTYLVAIKNSYELSNGFSGETNYQRSRFRWNYRRPFNAESPSVTLRDPSNVIIGILGQTGSIFDDIENTDQFQQKFVYKANKHTIKAGVDIVSSDFNLLGGGNPIGSYDVRLTAQQLTDLQAKNLGSNIMLSDIPSNVNVNNYQVELQTNYFGKRQTSYGIYVEDLINLTKKLNVAVGVRYDYDNLTKGGGSQGDVNNFAPRFSFNYQLDDQSVLRGGYGIFYDKYKYSTISDAMQFSSNSEDFKRQVQLLKDKGILPAHTDVDKVTFAGNINAAVQGVSYLNGPKGDAVQANRNKVFQQSLRILNPDGYQNPYSHQITIGYQRKLDYKTIFTADLLYSATNNYYQLWDLNAPTPYPISNPNNVVVRTVAQANATRPVPIASAGNYSVVAPGDTLRGIARDVLMTRNTGRARYFSAAFVLQKLRDNDSYSYRLSYVISSYKNNTDGINDRALDGNDFESEYGFGNNDRTHVINALFTYYAFKSFSVTPALLIQSGQPITRYVDGNRYINGVREFGGVTDLNGNGTTFGGPSDRYPGEPKNNDRLPWASTLDVNMQYTLKIKGIKPIEISMDIFNILNANNWSGFNATLGTGNQQQLGPSSSRLYQQKAASPPRQFQFGIRYVL